VLQEAGERNQARQELEVALYLDPDFIMAHLILASLAMSSGNRKDGARHLRNARGLLELRRPEEVIPESDGLTADRLRQVVEAMAR